MSLLNIYFIVKNLVITLYNICFFNNKFIFRGFVALLMDLFIILYYFLDIILLIILDIFILFLLWHGLILILLK